MLAPWVVFLASTASLRPADAATPAAKADYLVAPYGNDAWSGRLAEPDVGRTDGPFATIERARDAIRSLGAGRAKRTSPWVVQVREGVYRLRQSLTFAPADSGSESVPIVYEAFPGEQPVLSGGRVIRNWRPSERGIGPAKGRLWEASVPEARGGAWRFNQLYVNGRRCTRERTERRRCPHEPVSRRQPASGPETLRHPQFHLRGGRAPQLAQPRGRRA